MSESNETKQEYPAKPFQQPFFCHLENGVWDRKFRDKDGNIVKETPRFPQPFYCYLEDGKWDRKFREKEGNIVE